MGWKKMAWGTCAVLAVMPPPNTRSHPLGDLLFGVAVSWDVGIC